MGSQSTVTQTVDRATQVFDEHGHTVVDKESHTVVYDHDSRGGEFPGLPPEPLPE
ncbi:hypothetical protein [Streptomyces scopuliridis]|uniref:hypothetical protein n=1 Tax=Streptomyces scopuliridis TaxID=452529 RepID=UPI0036A27AA9